MAQSKCLRLSIGACEHTVKKSYKQRGSHPPVPVHTHAHTCSIVCARLFARLFACWRRQQQRRRQPINCSTTRSIDQQIIAAQRPLLLVRKQLMRSLSARSGGVRMRGVATTRSCARKSGFRRVATCVISWRARRCSVLTGSGVALCLTECERSANERWTAAALLSRDGKQYQRSIEGEVAA